jgi:D-serine deaminase-like pyridoxal phosphate-dependent protein
MPLLDELEKPTLLINADIARRNIAFMAEKARRQGVRFRPHFKTHQSAAVGEWFRQAGVKSITVSSVDMAEYFADHGWDEITIAFPLNIHQMGQINQLASRIQLGVLVESMETVGRLQSMLSAPLQVWIEIDSGMGRSGIRWDLSEEIIRLAQVVRQSSLTTLRGLLTHAGHTYTSSSPNEIVERYRTSAARMNALQSEAWSSGQGLLELSVGDTPGCTLSDDLGRVDEIRPGNFVFYDGQMLQLGVCSPQQVAAVMACPVVAVHPERGEAVLYGGAVHFSRDTINKGGKTHFGYVVALNSDGSWSPLLWQGRLVRLSQEHGIVSMPAEELSRIRPGDWIGVIPAHVCLAVAAMGSYRTLEGQAISIYTTAESA